MITNFDHDVAFGNNPFLNGNLPMSTSNIKITNLQSSDIDNVTQMIRRNLEGFEEHGSVLASTFRRLTDMMGAYDQEGRKFFIAKDLSSDSQCIGCAGIGPLHGLPVSEGVAEIRDLVVEPSHRRLGIGRRLLDCCLDEVVAMGYQQVYLETTPQMKHAQKLFIRNGFRPVTEGGHAAAEDSVPCYFVKEL